MKKTILCSLFCVLALALGCGDKAAEVSGAVKGAADKTAASAVKAVDTGAKKVAAATEAVKEVAAPLTDRQKLADESAITKKNVKSVVGALEAELAAELAADN